MRHTTLRITFSLIACGVTFEIDRLTNPCSLFLSTIWLRGGVFSGVPIRDMHRNFYNYINTVVKIGRDAYISCKVMLRKQEICSNFDLEP